MYIKDIGGEFALIGRLAHMVPVDHDQVVVGIGDDAAVLKSGNDPDQYILVTTDTLVADDHFKLSWARPDQIGIKAAECNISDIAAMGGTPVCLFVSLVLTPRTTVQWVEQLYSGLAESCRNHHAVIAGGDTTHGSVITIGITVLGTVPREHLCLRSHARAGDLLAVTGMLGASGAGLRLLTEQKPVSPYLMEKHLTPRCRMDAARHLAPIVHAMIDISDGLASEVNHICNRSNVGACVYADQIPLHPDVIEAGKTLGVNPVEFALNGGEDFELLFTVSPDNVDRLDRTGVKYHVVGKIRPASEGRFLVDPSQKPVVLKGGYNHFNDTRPQS
ncbi:MAG: thiamine-phosphate kinase [Desulfobacterales bacterium]|nr:thiamine-phosphate kinase [Desulfobacterales bacterium]MDD4073836.1 thiamine-phosphate kinase [Desulfobacterales bacterium]MDD4393383.1 thiamine-phosphate kinase [Desulfobacterales bacterium]